jgi:hypothetical protein
MDDRNSRTIRRSVGRPHLGINQKTATRIRRVKRLSQLVARLYPAQWRQRYGDEFDALIEDSRASWRSTFDILRGALKSRAVTAPSFLSIAVMLSMLGMLAGWTIRHELVHRPIPIELNGIDPVSFQAHRFEDCVRIIDPGDCGFKGDTYGKMFGSSVYGDGNKIVITYNRRIAHEEDRARMLADLYRRNGNARLLFWQGPSPIAAALYGLFAGLLFATLFAALRRLQNRLT